MATGRIDLKENVTKGAQRIADALRNVTKTAIESDKALDEAFEIRENIGRSRRRGGSGGSNLDPGGEAIDLSAAFERGSKDIIRQDKHLTNLLQQEDNKREKNRLESQKRSEKNAAQIGKETLAREESEIRQRTATIKKAFQARFDAEDKASKALKDGVAFRKNYRKQEAKQSEEAQKRESQALRDGVTFRKTQRRQEAKESEDAQKRQSQALKDGVAFRKAQNKQQAADERRLAREINSARRQIEVGLLELFFTLHSLNKPITQITDALVDFTLGNIRAYTEVEKFASTLKIVSGDANVAERDLKRLLDITVELAAIDTPGLIQFSARMQTAGLTSRQSEKALIGVTKRMEEQGKSAGETRRVLEQFIQAINANLISMQDFRPILREYPRLYQDFSHALGVTITDLDSLRAAAESVGGPTQAIIRLFEHVSEVAQGADINTINKQLDELKDRLFVLRAALGESLQPIILGALKLLNSLADVVSGLPSFFKEFISVLIIFTSLVGKTVSGAINILIATIAYFQLKAAIDQVRVMTEALNVMRASTLGANSAVAQIPTTTLNSVNALKTFSKVAIRFTQILAGIGIAASIAIPIITALTRQARLAREEYDSFISTILKIPKSITDGNVAIRRQIEELKEFRLELLKTQDEASRGFSVIVGPRGDLSEARAARGRGLASGNIEPLNKAERRFVALQKQVLATDANIEDLNVVLGEGEDAFDALRRIMIRTQSELDKALTEKDADKARRLQISIDSLVASFRLLWRESQRGNNTLKGTAEELIEIDYAIRRLERTQKSLLELPDNLIGFDTSSIQKNADSLIKALEREAELKKRLLELEERDEKKKALEIKKINEQLSFDKQVIAEDTAKEIARIEKEALEQRLQQELDLAQSLEDLRIKERRNRVELREKQEKLEEESIKKRLDSELKLAESLEALRISEFEKRLELREKQEKLEEESIKKRLEDELKVAEAIEAIRIKEFDRRLELREKQKKLEEKRAEEELKAFQEAEERRRLLIEHGPAVTEGRQEAQRRKENLEKVLELSDLIQREAERNQREISRIAGQFSRGLANSITDFIYEGEVGIAEFLKSFAKASTRIVLQARINAFVQKRISDDLTRHQIANIQKVAAAQVAAGVNASNITSAGVSNLASGIGGGLLSSSGIGIAISAVALGAIIYNAVKDGTEDAENDINIDGRSISKAQSSSTSRLVREGRIRI